MTQQTALGRLSNPAFQQLPFDQTQDAGGEIGDRLHDSELADVFG
ncbi:MAG: hypothetical protein Q8M07_14365 [Prosthecobacter sp.]|nr:hypothetical protein [Prosthecobacter sp.]